jgi:uncharacterized protein
MVLTDFPSSLNIYLTNRCNLNCRYCFVNKAQAAENGISGFFLEKGIGIFLKLPGPHKKINFTGGEPTLEIDKIRRAIDFIVDHVKKNQRDIKRCDISLVTNGTLLNKKALSFFKKNNVLLKVSVDGSKINNDLNRRFKSAKSRSAYDQVFSTLGLHLKKNRHPIVASLVFEPATIGFLLNNIYNLWKKGFACIDFFPELYSRWTMDKLNEAESVFNAFSDFYISLFRGQRSAAKIFENSFLHALIKKKKNCNPCQCSNIHLDWKGDFYVCDKALSLPEAAKPRYRIGNITKGIDLRHRHSLLQKCREEIRKITGKDCSKCRLLDHCLCPIGQYIFLKSQGSDFQTYFPQFCRISKLYYSLFSKIQVALKSNPLFVSVYGGLNGFYNLA